jgi:hypothetical protein
MARSISRMVLAVACVIVLAGCGSGVGGAGLSARATCRALGFSDYLIDSAFTGFRIDRDAGYSASESSAIASPGCRDGCITNPNVGVSTTLNECTSECTSCILAVVAEVYGIR